MVCKLDRLGRNTRDVLNLVHEIDQKDASLQVLEPAIDTAGAMGKMVFTVLGMVSEMELSFINSDRQKVLLQPRPEVFTKAGPNQWIMMLFCS